ncbi:CDP-alcohol phosphatidyltransferase family protein [Treponema pedis]|uniref:CDP-alcohol phosphatidyltransferase family protein n=1 Tax=Treponema pedis TaxID=409322 RepID=UPI003133DBBE
MERKIGKAVLFFWLFQCSAIFAVYKAFNTDSEVFSNFLIHISLWHGILLLFLVLHKSEFANINNQISSEKINIANLITLCRISSVPLIAFLLKHHQIPGVLAVLSVVLIIIFFTDLFDGLIARKMNQETGIGKMLDSMSDYSLLGLVSIVYFQLGLLPRWFFYLIIIRLMFQSLGMAFFMLLRFPMEVKSTYGGKITIAATMILYAVKLLQFFIPASEILENILMTAEYSCGIIIFVFLFEKVYIFYKHYVHYKTQKN